MCCAVADQGFAFSAARLRSILLGFLLIILSVSMAAQISPGPLSRAHQSLSGTTKCAACHKIGAATSALKCLECHKEIAQRLSESRGLHAQTADKSAGSDACARCHTEHKGEGYSLLRWDPSPHSFDHAKTGYTLEGKHFGLDCNRCHNPQHIAEFEQQTILVKDRTRTFLGLSRDCLSCHKDQHRGQLPKNCTQCHGFAGWKVNLKFDHGTTKYALVGKHAELPCQKCHKPAGPDRLVKYAGLSFNACTACHADPHHGAFKNPCESCHTTAGFSTIAKTAGFNHAKAKFALLGKHAGVHCKDCHAAADFKKRVAHAKCSDCHKPDPHGGQFRQRADGGECTACHTVDGFKPARYTLREHASTRYPLEGRHAEVICAKCHLPAGKATVFKLKYARCTDCHKDPHNGQFSSGPRSTQCDSCHAVTKAYKSPVFNLARHKQTRFPLNGGHAAVPCVDCHTAQAPGGSARYRFDDRSCAACHKDPHRGQFKELMSKPGSEGSAAGCMACHSPRSWKEQQFDHSKAAFALAGAHRGAPCAACHKPPALETNLRNVEFRLAPKNCYECHENPHGNQFAVAGKMPACSDCHNTNKWKPSLFNHDARTRFALQGAHKNVRCALCHKDTKLIQGKTVVLYAMAPTKCAACHSAA